MCTVLLPPGVNPTAVNKYININFQHNYCTFTLHTSGPGSSVGIANDYGLDGQGIESRWGGRFSAPVQTGPAAHPASCTMGTGSFPEVIVAGA